LGKPLTPAKRTPLWTAERRRLIPNCHRFCGRGKRLSSTGDPQEKNVLFKRLVNLLAVMEFLVSLNKTP